MATVALMTYVDNPASGHWADVINRQGQMLFIRTYQDGSRGLVTKPRRRVPMGEGMTFDDIKHAIGVYRPNGGLVHLGGYEEEPSDVDIEQLRAEILVDDEFGLVGETDLVYRRLSLAEFRLAIDEDLLLEP